MTHVFPSTRWSCVLALHDEDEAFRWRALNELMEMYRPAMVRYLVAIRRMPKDRAEDLVHAFIVDRVLEGELLQRADSGKGRLRSLLLRSLNNFITSAYRKDSAAKRSPAGGPFVEIDQIPESAKATLAHAEGMDEIWARHNLSMAIDAFRQDCLTTNRQAWWDVFEARVLAPILGEGTPFSYDQLAQKHGFTKPQDAANALVSAKRAFGRKLREVIAETVQAATDVDDEIQVMLDVLAGR